MVLVVPQAVRSWGRCRLEVTPTGVQMLLRPSRPRSRGTKVPVALLGSCAHQMPEMLSIGLEALTGLQYTP